MKNNTNVNVLCSIVKKINIYYINIVAYIFKIKYLPDSSHFHSIDFLIHLILFSNAYVVRV